MSRKYLLFQLYGPMASWGDIAVGDVRPTFDRPSKSAVFGLLAAALSLRRPSPRDTANEQWRLDEAHTQLGASFSYAVKLDQPGIYLHDYHTVQFPEGKEARDLPTRSDELVYPKVGAKETYRDYWCDMLAIVCLWMKSKQPYCTLEQLLKDLKEPVFTLYLGRKSCPTALPLYPVIVEASSLKGAFEKAPYHRKLKELARGIETCLLQSTTVRVFAEEDDNEGFGKEHLLVERWDQPASRSRWQFRPRQEKIWTITREDTHEPL